DLSALLTHRGTLADAIQTRRPRVQETRRQPQLKDVGAPIGEVEERVEVFLHPRVFVPPEVAPRIVVYEARRCDPGARRAGAQLSQLLFRQRPVDGLELIILILAHGPPPGELDDDIVVGLRVSDSINHAPAICTRRTI